MPTVPASDRLRWGAGAGRGRGPGRRPGRVRARGRAGPRARPGQGEVAVLSAAPLEVAISCALTREVAVLSNFRPQNCSKLPPRAEFRSESPPRGLRAALPATSTASCVGKALSSGCWTNGWRLPPHDVAAKGPPKWRLPEWVAISPTRWGFSRLLTRFFTTGSGNRHLRGGPPRADEHPHGRKPPPDAVTTTKEAGHHVPIIALTAGNRRRIR